MKCVCGFETADEKRFTSFRAAAVRHVSGMMSECDYPDDAIKLYVCPECGTVKVKLGNYEQEMKRVKRDRISWTEGFPALDGAMDNRGSSGGTDLDAVENDTEITTRGN
jgi:hypothetical protein